MTNPTATQQSIIEDVGDWIDQYNIADLIYDAVKEQCGVDPTVGQCQDVWYRVLDQLGDLVNACARHLPVDYGD